MGEVIHSGGEVETSIIGAETVENEEGTSDKTNLGARLLELRAAISSEETSLGLSCIGLSTFLRYLI